MKWIFLIYWTNCAILITISSPISFLCCVVSLSLQLINLLPHAMAPLHILCKGYLSSVLNQSSAVGGDPQRASPSSASGTTTNGDSEERMDVDGSDSETEIVTSNRGGGGGEVHTNGSSSKAAATNGSTGDSTTTISPGVESKLKKMAKVELEMGAWI